MIDQVTPRLLSAWSQQNAEHGSTVVLDVREPAELQLASVRPDGFELLAIPMRDIPERLADLDPARPIACLCHHGGRSMQVAAYLQSQGFQHLANIAGGIDAWSTELDHTVPRY